MKFKINIITETHPPHIYIYNPIYLVSRTEECFHLQGK